MTAACDNASVGVLITRPDGRWLMLERATPPVGVAPCAGHVFDEHDGYMDAAEAEVSEELGLTVKTLELAVAGWRANACRRGPGPRGTGHQWQVFIATVSGDLRPSPREVRNVRWCTPGDLQHLADRTAAYARGELPVREFAACPGIEPVWVWFLTELGLITMPVPDLTAVNVLVAGECHG